MQCILLCMCILQFVISTLILQEWLYKQLCKATSPIHPTLPPLLEEYVISVVLGPNSGQNTRNSLYAAVPTMRHLEFSEEEIMRVFGEDTCSTAARLLFLYYLLLYHDTYLSNLRMLGKELNRAVRVTCYSLVLCDILVISIIVIYLHNRLSYRGGI